MFCGTRNPDLPAAERDAHENRTTSIYDSLSRPFAEEKSLGHRTTTVDDPRGRSP
jgi:hypothetical protein